MQGTFPKKVLFWKSDSLGHSSKFMKFFGKIYLIVLPKQKVFSTQKRWSNVIFWSLLVAEGGLYTKIYIVEKTMPCVIFFKSDSKIGSKKNGKHQVVCFEKRSN